MFAAAYSLLALRPMARSRVGRAVLLVLLPAWGAACASSGAVPRPFPGPAAASPVSAAAPSAWAEAVADTALELRGIPYRNGGSDRAGFDCSGLVWYAFAQHGLDLPRTVAEQYRYGTHIDARALRKGDLVFFRTAGSGPTHVGIMIDAEQFVHAPSSQGVVRIERLSAAYWTERFVGARRVQAAQ